MRLQITRASRLPRWPLWAIVLVLAWALLAAIDVALATAAQTQIDLCLFHRFAGLPCPACGTGRACLAVAQGRLTDALRLNPLGVSLAVAGAAWLAFRAATGRSLKLVGGRRGRLTILLACIGAVLVNWGYLIANSL